MNLGAGQPAIPPLGVEPLVLDEDLFLLAMSRALDNTLPSIQSKLQSVIHNVFEQFRLTTPPPARYQQRPLEQSSTPISDPKTQIEIVHSHLWKARSKQVALKSTAATGGVKKRHRSRLGTYGSLATDTHLKRKVSFQRLVAEIAQDVKVDWRSQSSVVPSLLGSTVSTQVNNTHASFYSVSNTGTISFVNNGCGAVDSVFVESIHVGVSVRHDNQGPNSGEKVRECHALHLFDEMLHSNELGNVGKHIVGYMGIRDKGGGLATHCLIVDEYFEFPDNKITIAHLDCKFFVVSKHLCSKYKKARALVPSEAFTSVHGFVELDKIVVTMKKGEIIPGNITFNIGGYNIMTGSSCSIELMKSAIISTDGLVVKVISSRRLQDGREINELGSVTSRENTIVSSCSALVHSSKGIEGVRNASAPLFGSLVCAHLSTERNSSTIIPNFGILLQDSGGTHKLVGVRAKQDDQKTSLCGKSALHLFDEFSKSDGLCTAGKKIVANMSILDKGGGFATHCIIVDVLDMSTDLLPSATSVPMEIYGEERSVVKTDCGDSSKMNSLGQGTKPSSNSSNAKLLPPDWLSNVVSILETILQDGDTSWVFGERKGLEAVMQSFILPSMPLYVSVGQSISVVSSLVDMYAHCGTLMNAYMYNSAGNKSLSFWTIMINLFGMHGQNLFKRLLLDQKSVPDYLTSLVQVFDINGQMETDKGLANNSEEICLLITILIIQLHLNEGIEICKESYVIIGSALEFEKLWKTGTGSSVCSFADQKSLASSLPRHLSDNLSQLVEKTSSNLEIVSLIQQCLSRRFLSGEVADFIKSNPELSFMRYSADSLHSRDYDLFYMRNIKAPKQIMEALSSSANGKAVKEYTNIRIRDAALDTQSLALGFELLFASLSFIKVARMEMFGNVLNQGVNYKDIIVSEARNQGHKLHDQVFEFSFQLNHANACAISSNYGNGEIRRLVQGTNETCSAHAHAHAHAIIRMGKADFSLEEIEQLLFLNVNFQFIEATWASKLNGDSLVIMGGDLYRPVTIDQLAIMRIQVLMMTFEDKPTNGCLNSKRHFSYTVLQLLVWRFTFLCGCLGMELLMLLLQCLLNLNLRRSFCWTMIL